MYTKKFRKKKLFVVASRYLCNQRRGGDIVLNSFTGHIGIGAL